MSSKLPRPLSAPIFETSYWTCEPSPTSTMRSRGPPPPTARSVPSAPDLSEIASKSCSPGLPGATTRATCPTDSSRFQPISISRKPLQIALHVVQPSDRFGLRNRRSQVQILSGALTCLRCAEGGQVRGLLGAAWKRDAPLPILALDQIQTGALMSRSSHAGDAVAMPEDGQHELMAATLAHPVRGKIFLAAAEAILFAASAETADGGPAGMSVRQIAERVQESRRRVRYHLEV